MERAFTDSVKSCLCKRIIYHESWELSHCCYSSIVQVYLYICCFHSTTFKLKVSVLTCHVLMIFGYILEVNSATMYFDSVYNYEKLSLRSIFHVIPLLRQVFAPLFRYFPNSQPPLKR